MSIHELQPNSNSELELALPELLSTQQVADLFGVSTRSVRNWVKSGRLPALRVEGSGIQRFRRSDAMALLIPWES